MTTKCPAAKCGTIVTKENISHHLETCEEWLKIQSGLCDKGLTVADQILRDKNLPPISERHVKMTGTICYVQNEEKPYSLADVMAITKYVLRNIGHFQAARELGTLPDEVKKLTESKIYIAEMFV
jgi:hypothetical protein